MTSSNSSASVGGSNSQREKQLRTDWQLHGGFAVVASGARGFGGEGFGAVASGGGGFGGLASCGGGGFGGAAPAGSGFACANLAVGGFGQFGGQQGSGGFLAFGNA